MPEIDELRNLIRDFGSSRYIQGASSDNPDKARDDVMHYWCLVEKKLQQIEQLLLQERREG